MDIETKQAIGALQRSVAMLKKEMLQITTFGCPACRSAKEKEGSSIDSQKGEQ